MTFEQIGRASHMIFLSIVEEYKKTGTVPKLIANIAFTKYNEHLKLDPSSIEAGLLTSMINDNIVRTFYQNAIKFEQPISDYVPNKEDWRILDLGNGNYQFEGFPKNK